MPGPIFNKKDSTKPMETFAENVAKEKGAGVMSQFFY
jgi:hypothetical protein